MKKYERYNSDKHNWSYQDVGGNPPYPGNRIHFQRPTFWKNNLKMGEK
jgi:hypothetical protein